MSVQCLVMLCRSVLCCAVLCCAVLCCAVLCCAVLCCAVLCCAVLCCAVLCCAVLCWAVLCETVILRCFLLYCALQVLCSVTAIVTDAKTGEPLTDVYMAGTWSARRRLSGWPHDVTATTSDTNVAILPAASLLFTSRGHGCVFRLISVVKEGYVLSPNTRRIFSQGW
jgi:hypothetical protein